MGLALRIGAAPGASPFAQLRAPSWTTDFLASWEGNEPGRERAAQQPPAAPSMAKVTEADPRWIVAERQDGQNVNGWHWTER